MRAVVIGGSGQIGGSLIDSLRERGAEAVGTYATVAYPGLVHLDAADLESSATWIRASRPDVVFYPAGFTWVDGCERDRDKAFFANHAQPLNIARAVASYGGRFINFSTDYVFDGLAGPYTELDPPNPLSVYGRAKRHAELDLERELGELQLTIRTAWVFGPERQGKNFAYQLVRALQAGKPMIVPSDQVSSPSYGPDVARAAVELAERRVSGLIHVVGPETIDRLTFARAIALGFDLDPSAISAKPTAELAQGAPRPLQGGLLTPRLDTLIPAAMRPLDQSTADFVARLDRRSDYADPRKPAG